MIPERKGLVCRHCGLAWPGDSTLTIDDLIKRAKPELPICIKAPPSNRWFVDSGINGHVFEERRHSLTPAQGEK